MTATPRVGISSCLLGHDVRYDGGHKQHAAVMAELAPLVQLVAVCPEVEAGMGTPREPVHLLRDDVGGIRLAGVSSGDDWTFRMQTLAAARIGELVTGGLHGYILKSRSPSCGLHVHITGAGQSRSISAASDDGRGLFASALLQALPNLPVVEDEDVREPDGIAHFAERVFACWRLSALFESHWSARDLVRFHTAHKMQLLSRSRPRYTELGRLVADAVPGQRLREDYERRFMQALAIPSTIGRHVDVLTHLAGHLKGLLPIAERDALAAAIEEYRLGQGSRRAALDRLRSQAKALNATYVLGQTYLYPLGLRHIDRT